MRTGWLPGDMVLAPGILVIALTQESGNDHCLLLIRGRPWDVWIITDPTVHRDKFQYKPPSDPREPGFLIIHPRHCRKSHGGEADVE